MRPLRRRGTAPRYDAGPLRSERARRRVRGCSNIAGDDGRTSQGPEFDSHIDVAIIVAGLCEPGPPTPRLLEARISGLTEATYRKGTDSDIAPGRDSAHRGLQQRSAEVGVTQRSGSEVAEVGVRGRRGRGQRSGVRGRGQTTSGSGSDQTRGRRGRGQTTGSGSDRVQVF